MSPTKLGFAVQPPPKSCICLWIQNSDTEAERGTDPEKVGLGYTSGFLFLSLHEPPSSAHITEIPTDPPSDSPHSSRELLAAFPFLLYHSDSHTPIQAAYFCFHFTFLRITNETHNSTLPNASQYCLNVSKQQSEHKCQNRKATLGLVRPG